MFWVATIKLSTAQYGRGLSFDAGRISDLDLALVSKQVFSKAKALGFKLRTEEAEQAHDRRTD
jgi:hypothetical protein